MSGRKQPLPTGLPEGFPLASGVGEAKSPELGLQHEAQWEVRVPQACAPNTITYPLQRQAQSKLGKL